MTTQANKTITSGGGKLFLIIMGVFGASALYRLNVGLGVSTNLSDEYPWGLWIAMDVMVGVALAAGGFAIAAAVYIFNMQKYKSLARPAIVTAYFGYLIVGLGIFLDIGKPFTLWHALVMWQHTSIMFEVVMCVNLYLLVLTFEFAPIFFAGIGKTKLARFFHGPMVLFPLVIAGVTLSYFHQSSLGSLFLLNEADLNHLWWTTFLPYNFYLSAIVAGLAMVTFETIVAGKVFNHKVDKAIIAGLAKGTAIAMFVYLGVRLVDMVANGVLSLALAGGIPATLFIVEIGFLGLLPLLLLVLPSVRNSVVAVFMTQVLVIAGVALNRFNVTFLAQGGDGATYFPSLVEFAVTIGLIATVIFMYRVAVLKLPVFFKAD